MADATIPIIGSEPMKLTLGSDSEITGHEFSKLVSATQNSRSRTSAIGK